MMVDTWEMTNDEVLISVTAREDLIDSLALLLSQLIAYLRPSAVALLAALIYSRRMFFVAGRYQSRGHGCSRAVLVTALMVSVKYYDAFARGTLAEQSLEAWLPYLSDGSYDGLQLRAMECDFILHIDYKLELSAETIERFFEAGLMDEGKRMYAMVPGSVDFVAAMAETASCGPDAVVPDQSCLDTDDYITM